MKLTDESVAKKLGWKKTRRWGWLDPDGHQFKEGSPAFTTSLDAIVAEIEARGLWWCASTDGYIRAAVGPKNRPENLGTWVNRYPPAEGLCRALMAYIVKEAHHAKR